MYDTRVPSNFEWALWWGHVAKHKHLARHPRRRRA